MTHRRTLPHRRPSTIFEAEHTASGKSRRFQVSVGYFEPIEDGAPAEVFISGTKAGSEVEATARDGAVLLSIALQYGVPLDVIRAALTREPNGAPSSIIGTVVDVLDRGQDIAPAAGPSWREQLKDRVRKIVHEEMAGAT
jgi:hypothetical protein